MKSDATDTRGDYFEEWRGAHGDVLAGMLAEGLEQRPERARRESIMAQLHSFYTRARWTIALALAILSVIVTIVGIVLFSTMLTDQTASLIRVALIGIVPALSLLAVIAAVAASRRMLRTPWLSAILGLVAIVTACTAHMVWYRQVDTVDTSSVTAIWILLIIASVALTTVAVAMILIPTLLQARMPQAGAVTVGIVTGAVAGVVGVAFLALPFASVIISIAALVTVIALRRRDQHVRSTAVPAVPAV